MAPALQKGIRKGGMAAEPVSSESFPSALLAWAVRGIKGRLPAAEHKTPQNTPSEGPVPAGNNGFKGQHNAGLPFPGEEGAKRTTLSFELLGTTARSAKMGLLE